MTSSFSKPANYGLLDRFKYGGTARWETSYVWWDGDALGAIVVLEGVWRFERFVYDGVGVASRHCL